MYVIKLPLIVSPAEARKINSSLAVGRLIYNSFLSEAERRRKACASHPCFIEAGELKGDANKEKRLKLSKQAIAESGFYFRSAKKYGRNNGLEKFLHKKILGKSYLCEHYGRHEATDLGKRAFAACGKVLFHKSKKVHFKRRSDFLESAAGTTLASGLTWRGNHLRWGKRLLLCPQSWVFEDEKIAPVLNQYKTEEDAKIALKNRCIKQAKLVRKQIHGQWRYFAYLTCEGTPVEKEKIFLGVGKVGLDIGPSTIAYVSEKDAANAVGLLDFCGELTRHQVLERKLARRLDRQRRSNNPQNYNVNGTIKQGPKSWVVSERMKKTQAKLADIRRKEAETRRCLHGRLVNLIRSLGDCVKIEKLSYKGWQQGLFGRSVGKHAPGMFVEMLKNRFKFTEGMVDELNAYTLKLSQRCPQCGQVKKKKLSERIHHCECGFRMQRDLVSALLAICVSDDGTAVQADTAKLLCQERGPLLRVAWGKTELEKLQGLRNLHAPEGTDWVARVGVGQVGDGHRANDRKADSANVKPHDFASGKVVNHLPSASRSPQGQENEEFAASQLTSIGERIAKYRCCSQIDPQKSGKQIVAKSAVDRSG